MNSVHEDADRLLTQLRTAGWGGAVLTALDALEPLAVIGAQILYAAGPAARLLGDRRGQMTAFARLLETPDGLDHIRRVLGDET